jgi:phosphate starvation-inducible protein PhoH
LPYDQNIEIIRRETGADINQRDTAIVVAGYQASVDLASTVLENCSS